MLGVRKIRDWWGRRQKVDRIVPPILVLLIIIGSAWQPVSTAIASAAKVAAPAQIFATER